MTARSREPDRGIDSGRAHAAYVAVFATFNGMIDAVMNDRTLTPDQRRAKVASIRQHQRLAAEAARQAVLDDERAAVKERALRRQQPRKHHRR